MCLRRNINHVTHKYFSRIWEKPEINYWFTFKVVGTVPSGFEDLCQTSVDLEASMYDYEWMDTCKHIKGLSYSRWMNAKNIRLRLLFYSRVPSWISIDFVSSLERRTNKVEITSKQCCGWLLMGTSMTSWYQDVLNNISNKKLTSFFCAYQRLKLVWFFVKVELAWLITWCDMECTPEGAITFTCLVSLVREIKHCDEKKSFIFHLVQTSLSRTARFAEREIIKV